MAHDPEWAARFETERAVLLRTLREWIVGDVRHVGSTAVPGLIAKPTIDILVGVRDLASSRASFGALIDCNYEHAPYRIEEEHWFCKPDRWTRDFHLHLVPHGSPRYVAMPTFRDRLRADPSLASEYAALKQRLAAEHADDREAYTAAKAPFVERHSAA